MGRLPKNDFLIPRSPPQRCKSQKTKANQASASRFGARLRGFGAGLPGFGAGLRGFGAGLQSFAAGLRGFGAGLRDLGVWALRLWGWASRFCVFPRNCCALNISNFCLAGLPCLGFTKIVQRNFKSPPRSLSCLGFGKKILSPRVLCYFAEAQTSVLSGLQQNSTKLSEMALFCRSPNTVLGTLALLVWASTF